ncbi:MAG: hypothetical protein M3M89_05810 [Thermoproteota archaeon]|nr:hypothetical protein [Thermoproteota archaeon]
MSSSSESEEPLFRMDLDCHHSHIVLASKLAKPARRDAHTRTPMFLCESCMRRERGTCSIDPVHKVVGVTAIPPTRSSRRLQQQEEEGEEEAVGGAEVAE